MNLQGKEKLTNLQNYSTSLRETTKRMLKDFKREDEYKDKIPNEYFKAFVKAQDLSASTYIDALKVFDDSLVEFNKIIEKVLNKLQDGPLNEVVLDEVIDNLSSTIFTMSELMVSIFLPVKKAKGEQLKSSAYSSGVIIKKYKNIDTELTEVPSGYGMDVVKNIVSKTSMLLYSGFVGNPFFHIGRFRIKMMRLRKEKLKEDREFLNHELVMLELNEQASEKSKKYYKKRLDEIDMEIIELSQ